MRRTALFLAAAMVAGCATSPAPPPIRTGSLTGTVTYRERLALPPGAQVTVIVWDAFAQLPEAKVGETTFQAATQVPLPFEVFFDPAAIQADHTYAARASIKVDGKVLFESAAPVPVITQGMPTTGVVILVRSAATLP